MPKSREVTDSQKAMKSQEYVDESSSDAETDSSSSARPKDQSEKKGGLSDREPDDVSDLPSDDNSSGSSSETSRGRKRKAETASTVAKDHKKRTKTRDAPKIYGNITKEPVSIPGYSTVSFDLPGFVSDTKDMFSNLEGKQIWHITVPASVPITSIEWLDIPAALRGEPILHHEGTDYNLFASAAKDETLLLPRDSAGAYSRIETEISRNFHMREMAPRPKTQTTAHTPSTTSDGAPTADGVDVSDIEFFAKEKGLRRPARQQPSGLLMRYQPYGSNKLENGPYRLPQPDRDDNEEDDTAGRNGLVVPHLESSDDSQIRKTASKKSKHIKKSRQTSSPAYDRPVLSSDAMDVDTTRNDIVSSAPQVKVKKSKDKSGLEKKRKKHKERE